MEFKPQVFKSMHIHVDAYMSYVRIHWHIWIYETRMYVNIIRMHMRPDLQKSNIVRYFIFQQIPFLKNIQDTVASLFFVPQMPNSLHKWNSLIANVS